MILNQDHSRLCGDGHVRRRSPAAGLHPFLLFLSLQSHHGVVPRDQLPRLRIGLSDCHGQRQQRFGPALFGIIELPPPSGPLGLLVD